MKVGDKVTHKGRHGEVLAIDKGQAQIIFHVPCGPVKHTHYYGDPANAQVRKPVRISMTHETSDSLRSHDEFLPLSSLTPDDDDAA